MPIGVLSSYVKCTALIMEAYDNVPEIKTAFYFKPIDHLGKWRLCMVDSRRGDKTIITPEQKDSMQNLYNKEMRDKKRSQGKNEKISSDYYFTYRHMLPVTS